MKNHGFEVTNMQLLHDLNKDILFIEALLTISISLTFDCNSKRVIAEIMI